MKISLWLLTVKNFKILFRDKGAAMIVLFAPLLIILFLGLSYNTSTQFGINIGVYAPTYGDDINSFLDLLQEEEFTITKYENSIDGCVEDIKTGLRHTCINLPASLLPQDNSQNEVTFYIDPSRINLVWMIQRTVEGKFDLQSAQISKTLTSNILSTLSETKTKIDERKSDTASIKEKNSQVSANTQQIKSSLAGLDLAVPAATYNVSSLDSLDLQISTALNDVDIAIDKLENSNLSSTTTALIKSPLNRVKVTLGGATDSVNGSLGLLITGLENDLASAKTKLNAASRTISGSSTTLDSANTALSETSGALDTLQTSLDEMKKQIESLQVTEAGTVVSPLVTKIETVGQEGTYLNYLLPTLLILVIMFSSLLLGTTLVMMEKTSPAYLRNFFLPVRKVTFILSIYTTNILLALFELLIILGISIYFIPTLLNSLGPLILLMFLTATVFIFLGMAIGYIFSSEETGILASISLGNLFLFFSGVLLPLEGLPVAVRQLMQFNPFVIAKNTIREVLIFQTPLQNIGFNLILLVSYVVGLFIIILIIESLLHKQITHRFLRHHHRAHRQKDKKDKQGA